jgi:hypothetical protein
MKLNPSAKIAVESNNQSIIINILEEGKYYYVEIWSKNDTDSDLREDEFKPLGFKINRKSFEVVDKFTPCQETFTNIRLNQDTLKR